MMRSRLVDGGCCELAADPWFPPGIAGTQPPGLFVVGGGGAEELPPELQLTTPSAPTRTNPSAVAFVPRLARSNAYAPNLCKACNTGWLCFTTLASTLMTLPVEFISI